MLEFDRRQFTGLGFLWALAAALKPGGAHAQDAGLELGSPQPFAFDSLRKRASDMAKQRYVAPTPPVPEIIRTIDFDAVQKITFRPPYALWRDGPGPYPIRFFHLNKFVDVPVRIHAVAGGQARHIRYNPAYFSHGDAGLRARLPEDLGFAGFRLMNARGVETDWLAFLGASYFRSSGDRDQYGASARGIAINSGMSIPEEFPRFSEFWLEAPEGDTGAVTVYALLEGQSVTGAYRFAASRDRAPVIDVHAELFFRSPVERLGLAPLTSMFWYAENGRNGATDWRPEIHDTDGLALWTGTGERIWRPLVNPPGVQTNTFLDENPKGFGLMQRDRNFENYQDDGAFYDRRPGIWIEPRGNWGRGAVVLVELPTDDEIHDNIVAFWQPEAEIARGTALSLDYRLYWQSEIPQRPDNIGLVVATRTGHGGVPGQAQRPANAKKFVIDFEGGPLEAMRQRFDLTPEITVSRGEVENPYAIKVVGTNRWRAVFDVALGEGSGPVDMRCYLRLGERTLTETWLYQYHPPTV